MEVTLNNILPSAPRSTYSLALTLIYPMPLFAVAITRPSSSSVRTLSGSIQSHTHCFTACLSLGVRRSESEAHQSPPSTTDLKRAQWYTSASPTSPWLGVSKTRRVLCHRVAGLVLLLLYYYYYHHNNHHRHNHDHHRHYLLQLSFHSAVVLTLVQPKQIRINIQSDARNVIPLIVHITHFYYYKSIWDLVQN
jgi:hypothetical protein